MTADTIVHIKHFLAYPLLFPQEWMLPVSVLDQAFYYQELLATEATSPTLQSLLL